MATDNLGCSAPTAVGNRTRDRAADLVIEDLASREAELLEDLGEEQRDNQWQRQALHVALALLHTSNGQRDNYRTRLIRCYRECRALRARLTGNGETA